MTAMRGHLIIIGASARAAAQSAIRAGYSPWCIDLFADRDLQAIAPVKRCPRELWPQGILELMRDAPPGPVLFTGAMENHLEVVRAIQIERPTWGLDAMRMAVLRDSKELDRLGGDCLFSPPTYERVGPFLRLRMLACYALLKLLRVRGPIWLQKPRRGAAGIGIRPWRPWQKVETDSVVQMFVQGMGQYGVDGMSVLFVARRGRCKILSVQDQINGAAEFGARPFQYVGNIGPIREFIIEESFMGSLRILGARLAETLNLSGIFGVDLVPTVNGNLILEINPRYTASVELWERATGRSAMLAAETMKRGCRRATMGAWRGCQGKAIVYTKFDCELPDLYDIFERNEVADVPVVGSRLRRGEPICTIFASGNRAECVERLRAKAQLLYTRLSPA